MTHKAAGPDAVCAQAADQRFTTAQAAQHWLKVHRCDAEPAARTQYNVTAPPQAESTPPPSRPDPSPLGPYTPIPADMGAVLPLTLMAALLVSRRHRKC